MDSFEKIKDSLAYEINSAKRQIKEAQAKLERLEQVDTYAISRDVYVAKLELGIPFSDWYSLSFKEKPEIILRTKEAAYETVLEHDNAMLGYSGKYLKANVKHELPDGSIAYQTIEAKVPEQVIETLIACGKIKSEVSVSQYSSC